MVSEPKYKTKLFKFYSKAISNFNYTKNRINPIAIGLYRLGIVPLN